MGIALPLICVNVIESSYSIMGLERNPKTSIGYTRLTPCRKTGGMVIFYGADEDVFKNKKCWLRKLYPET